MTTENETYRSLLAIRVRKQQLKKEINAEEKHIAKLWNDIFHPNEHKGPQTSSQRFMSLANTSMGLIDGAILGWKLYRKFKRR